MKKNSLRESIMRIMILSLFISVLISLIALIVDSTPPDLTRIPTENFVSLSITKSIALDCEEDYGDCEEPVVLEGSSASGMVFSEDEDGNSLILTAGHFCETIFGFSDQELDPSISLLFDIKTSLTITDFYGSVWDAEIVDLDRGDDLCLVRSEMPAFRKIKMARDIPSVGEKIYTISAPLSIRSDGAAPHFEGIFSGCDSMGICFFGVPAIFGSSGSLVLNDNYEVIGMIQMADPNFPAVGMGVSVRDIMRFLDKNEVNY